MSTHTKHHGVNTFYFVTFTCYKWLSLIHKTNLYGYFQKWSSQLSKRGVSISAYVIMPNHVHFLFYVDESCIDFNKAIGESKRFLAYEIVKRLKNQNETEVLRALSEGVQESEKKKGKKHQVFRLSFDAKEVSDVKDLSKVVDYIHLNPTEGKWELVNDYVKYPYSSAGFYEEGKDAGLKLLDYREVI